MANENPPQEETHIVVDYKRRKKEIEEAEINARRETIKKIIDEIHLQGGHYDAYIIKQELTKFGYYPSHSTISRDLVEIEKYNPFLIDLMRYQYSAHFEQCWRQLEQVAREAQRMYNQKWTNSKIVKKYVEGPDGKLVTTEEVVTEEIAGPKNDALKIWMDAVSMKLKVFNGGIIDTAIGLASKDIVKLKERNEQLEKENEKLKEKLPPEN